MIRMLCVLGILGLSAAAHADSTLTFTTIDEVQRNGEQITFTGIVSGQATPTTQTFDTSVTSGAGNSSGDGCERAGLMMMSRPGRYQLRIYTVDFAGSSCRLVRQTQ